MKFLILMWGFILKIFGRKSAAKSSEKVSEIEIVKEPILPPAIIIDDKMWISPNFSTRYRRVDAIILHHTGGSFPGCASWLCNPEPKDIDGNLLGRVSCHYIVNTDGLIYQLVDDGNRAWHAGRGAFDVDGDGVISPVEREWNDRSLGIEIVAVDPYRYTSFQLHSVEKLVRMKLDQYRIRPDLILGHKEISPGRKFDPANFDMVVFRKRMQV